MSKKVELKSVSHPSGRSTLMQRDMGGTTWHDMESESRLFGNIDREDFDKAVKEYAEKLEDAGISVASIDWGK